MVFLEDYPELIAKVHRSLPLDLLPVWCAGRTLDFFDTYQLIAAPSMEKSSRNSVYKATEDGCTFAIKKYEVTEDALKICFREAAFLRRLRHPHIAELTAIFKDSSTNAFYLQMPFYENGQLDEWIEKNSPDAVSIRRALVQVPCALNSVVVS